MAAKKIHRYLAGEGGSSRKLETVEVRKRTHEERVIVPAEQKSRLLRGADYILSRLPATKYVYERWSHGRRLVLGYAPWVIVILIIAGVITAVL